MPVYLAHQVPLLFGVALRVLGSVRLRDGRGEEPTA